jgi:hypothetical protein
MSRYWAVHFSDALASGLPNLISHAKPEYFVIMRYSRLETLSVVLIVPRFPKRWRGRFSKADPTSVLADAK